MQFDTEHLLAFRKRRAEVRTLLEGAREGKLHISEAIAYCATALALMRRDLKELFAVHQRAAEFDFYRLQDLHQRTTHAPMPPELEQMKPQTPTLHPLPLDERH